MTSTPSPQVQRQIVLPLSKAVEIAYKSIRLRLSRSLLVTSGIVLALAFLMSILATDAMISGMRQWAVDFPESAQFQQLTAQRDQLQNDQLGPVDAELRKAAGQMERGGQAGAVSATVAKFDAEQTFGSTLADLQKSLGVPLPAPESDLVTLLTIHPETIPTMRRWIADATALKGVRDQLIAPRRLQETMKNAGVPSTPAEIASNKIQTRWLLALALLVAFVGILNAMLMSVTERFREIGTMKCLGALDSFIIKLFLIESLFQGGVGTTIGVFVGLLLSMASMTSSYGSYAWMNVPWMGLVYRLLACFGVGVGLTVAGAVYPAWQAARMQPIEAMRVEA
jgi:predicted lysophospholipase L1 biosynthesis ABC-type transport system permease subunit